MSVPRAQQREGMTAPTRLRLLEVDVDTLEGADVALRKQIEVVAAKVDARLSKIQWSIISLLVSVVTGIVVFVVTLGAGGHL